MGCASHMAQLIKNPPAVQETQEMHVQSMGWEGPLERTCIPLQYSCLENRMDRGVWWAAAYGLTKTQT